MPFRCFLRFSLFVALKRSYFEAEKTQASQGMERNFFFYGRTIHRESKTTMANDAVGRALERWRRVVELFTQKYATNAGKFRPFRRKETETKRDRSDSFRFEAKVIPISSRNLISIFRRYSWPVFPWLSRGFEIDLLACSINNPPTVPLQKRELFLVILSIPRELFPNSSRLEKNTAGRSKWLSNKMDSVYFSSPVEPCIDSSQLRLYFKLSRSFISSDIGGTSGRASI